LLRRKQNINLIELKIGLFLLFRMRNKHSYGLLTYLNLETLSR
jgi:hypothetical protein